MRRGVLLLCFLFGALFSGAQVTRTYTAILRSNVGTDTMWDDVSFRIYGIAPGLSAPVTLPAPMLYANEGDSVVLNARVVSQNEHHTIHLHGMDVDTRNDGDPATSFYLAHQQDTTYSALCSHAGTYLYHCHVSDVTHVQLGMYGLLVVRAANGAPTAWTNGPYINQDYKWLFSEIDRSWHDTIPFHDVVLDTTHIPEYRPDYFLINGKAQQEIDADDSIRIHGMVHEPIYIRLANIGFYTNRVVFSAVLGAKVIDSDGRPLPSEIVTDTVELMPGERYGVLLKPAFQNTGDIEVQYLNMNTGLAEHTEYVPYEIAGTWSDVGEMNDGPLFNVFPNPVSTNRGLVVYTDPSLLGSIIEIINLAGKVVMSARIATPESILALPPLASGIYFVKLHNHTFCKAKRIVIR